MSDEKQKKTPSIGGINQYATFGGKTTKRQNVQDTESLNAQATKHQDVQTSERLDIQKPKRVRQTVYLTEANDEWVRDYINAERKRKGKRVEISDVVNEAMRRMKESEQ